MNRQFSRSATKNNEQTSPGLSSLGQSIAVLKK